MNSVLCGQRSSVVGLALGAVTGAATEAGIGAGATVGATGVVAGAGGANVTLLQAAKLAHSIKVSRERLVTAWWFIDIV